MKKIFAAQKSQQELAQLLQKPPFDAVKLSARVAAGVRAVFGAELTAAAVVDKIVADVREQGDTAILRYTAAFDGVNITAGAMEVTAEEFATAKQKVEPGVLAALELAIANVTSYHREQLPKSWLTYREHGSILGQNCLPLERVGIYVPGGTAAYPSSVIMNAVPAKVAGVREIIMVVPPTKDGSANPVALTAAKMAGVTRVFKVGGAQAIAALAFGTATIPRVDKITGPGNIFVTLAKKAVYGYCDIDMLAGPSEILIVADKNADPRYVAADLLSQAEHDVLASSMLFTDSTELASAVEQAVVSQLAVLPRQAIAEQALNTNGLIIVTNDIAQAMELANIAAPEHLEILTAEPFRQLPYVRNAGAVFLGPYSPEPLGDYLAGPNHILPTGGTARYYSVLNVETFMKRTSIIAYTQPALQAVNAAVECLAQAEGLDGHANAVRLRRIL